MEKENNNKKEVKKEEVKVTQNAKKTENKDKKKEEPKFSKVETKNLKKEDKKKDKKEKVKKEKNKNSKVGFWVSGIVLIIILLVVVAALIILPTSPEKSVEGMLNCLKNGDFAGVSKYVDSNEFLNDAEDLNNSTISQDMQVLFFDKMSWKVLKTTKENDTAKVEVEIVNKDFKTIISNYMKKAFQSALTGGNVSDEEQKNYLMDELKNENISTVTANATLEAKKVNDEWKVVVNDSLISALLPGFEDAINSMESLNLEPAE